MEKFLTRADQRALRASKRRGFWRCALVLLPLLPLFWFGAAFAEVLAAERLAGAEGFSLGEVAGLWYSADPERMYSGLELLAVKRLEAAFWKGILGLVFAMIALGVALDLRRQSRIFDLLKAQDLIRET